MIPETSKYVYEDRFKILSNIINDFVLKETNKIPSEVLERENTKLHMIGVRFSFNALKNEKKIDILDDLLEPTELDNLPVRLNDLNLYVNMSIDEEFISKIKEIFKKELENTYGINKKVIDKLIKKYPYIWIFPILQNIYIKYC